MKGFEDQPPAWKRKNRAKQILQEVQNSLLPGDLVIDCGANIGAVTVPLAGTGADVLAFEPDPLALSELSQNVEAFPNVTVRSEAVGIKNHQVFLQRATYFDDDPLGKTIRSSILRGGKWMSPSDIVVDVIDLPMLLRELVAQPRRVRFLKLDIEGAELDILTEMLRHDLFDQIDLTVAELHPGKFPKLAAEFAALRTTVHERYPASRVWLDWI